MKKIIIVLCVMSLIIAHELFASPDQEQSNNLSTVIVPISPARRSVEIDLELAALRPPVLSVRAKIAAGLSIGVPLVFCAAYVGIH